MFREIYSFLVGVDDPREHLKVTVQCSQSGCVAGLCSRLLTHLVDSIGRSGYPETMNTKSSIPSVDELLSLSSPRDIGGSLSITKMMLDIQDFGLNTFDFLDANGNGFLSRTELECALAESRLNSRQVSYVRFMLANLEKISRAVDDGDGISPCGISRADIVKGISRSDLVRFFCNYIK